MPRKPERMDSLRNALIRRLESGTPGFRELQAVIDRWDRQGFSNDPRRDLAAAYPELEFADVEAFYAAQVEGRPVTMTVVGDPRRVDRDALAKWGEVITVKEKRVYPR